MNNINMINVNETGFVEIAPEFRMAQHRIRNEVERTLVVEAQVKKRKWEWEQQEVERAIHEMWEGYRGNLRLLLPTREEEIARELRIKQLFKERVENPHQVPFQDREAQTIEEDIEFNIRREVEKRWQKQLEVNELSRGRTRGAAWEGDIETSDELHHAVVSLFEARPRTFWLILSQLFIKHTSLFTEDNLEKLKKYSNELINGKSDRIVYFKDILESIKSFQTIPLQDLEGVVDALKAFVLLPRYHTCLAYFCAIKASLKSPGAEASFCQKIFPKLSMDCQRIFLMTSINDAKHVANWSFVETVLRNSSRELLAHYTIKNSLKASSAPKEIIDLFERSRLSNGGTII